MPDLSWVKNLYEVGAPIRDAARDVGFLIADANDKLEQAKKDHAVRLTTALQEAGRVERKVSSLWSQPEIEAAKRGFVLANGVEFKLND